MFLSIWDVIQVPFGYLLEYLYRFTSSYGWALIIFAFIIRFVLLPTTAKSKKSTMKMSRLTPQVQFLQKNMPMTGKSRLWPCSSFIKRKAFLWAPAVCGAWFPC